MVRARWHAAAAGPPPGRMNSFSGGSASLKPSSACFEPRDVLGRDDAMSRDAQLAAQVEQLVLDFGQAA